MIGMFSMRKSIYGNYIAVRVRDARGNEDTVDQLYSPDECRHAWNRLLADGLLPWQTAAEFEIQLKKLVTQ